jgi:hypothetical protein
MVGLNVYMRYRQHKRSKNLEFTQALTENGLRFNLRKWRGKTLHHAKIYYLRDLVNRLLKKQLFKQNSDLIQSCIHKKQDFLANIDTRKKKQFFCEWRRHVAHKNHL